MTPRLEQTLTEGFPLGGTTEMSSGARRLYAAVGHKRAYVLHVFARDAVRAHLAVLRRQRLRRRSRNDVGTKTPGDACLRQGLKVHPLYQLALRERPWKVLLIPEHLRPEAAPDA